MPNALYNLGIAYRDLGNRHSALSYYQRAIQLRPQEPDYRYALGNLHSDLGNYQEALNEYNEAINIVGDFGNAFYNRGKIKGIS